MRETQKDKTRGGVVTGAPPSGSPNALQRFLRRGKDAAIETGARIALNSRLSGIAEIVELSLDTGQHCVHGLVRLCGDADTIEVQVHSYRLRERKNIPEIEVAEVSASREWLQNVLTKFVVGQWIEIPPAAKTALEILT